MHLRNAHGAQSASAFTRLHEARFGGRRKVCVHPPLELVAMTSLSVLNCHTGFRRADIEVSTARPILISSLVYCGYTIAC
jgi:hypothetical protein